MPGVSLLARDETYVQEMMHRLVRDTRGDRSDEDFGRLDLFAESWGRATTKRRGSRKTGWGSAVSGLSAKSWVRGSRRDASGRRSKARGAPSIPRGRHTRTEVGWERRRRKSLTIRREGREARRCAVPLLHIGRERRSERGCCQLIFSASHCQLTLSVVHRGRTWV